MRFSYILTGALACAAAAPAMAQDTAPPKALTVTGGATLVSDYRFRGISQTDRKVAIQGTFTIAHRSGFYATVWASSIDDYVANGADAEVDLIAGYSHTFAGGIKIDGGVLYYYYPGGGHANTDFVEPYIDVSATYGPVTGKITANYAPKQKALTVGNGSEDNLYLAGDLTAGIPTTPFSLSAHLGHTFGPDYLSIGKGYTDWNLGVSATLHQITAGVSYVDTDSDLRFDRRNLSGAGVVASLGVAF